MNKTHKGLPKKLTWMLDNVFVSLMDEWKIKEFKKKQQLNKTNRTSTTSGSLHTKGFISMFKHKRKDGLHLSFLLYAIPNGNYSNVSYFYVPCKYKQHN